MWSVSAFGLFCVVLTVDACFSPGCCCAALVCVCWDRIPRAVELIYLSPLRQRQNPWCVNQWTKKMGFPGRFSWINAVLGCPFLCRTPGVYRSGWDKAAVLPSAQCLESRAKIFFHLAFLRGKITPDKHYNYYM